MELVLCVIKLLIMFLYSKKNIWILDSLAGYCVVQSLFSLVTSWWIAALIALPTLIPIIGFIFRRCLFLGTAKHIYFLIVAGATIISIFI